MSVTLRSSYTASSPEPIVITHDVNQIPAAAAEIDWEGEFNSTEYVTIKRREGASLIDLGNLLAPRQLGVLWDSIGLDAKVLYKSSTGDVVLAGERNEWDYNSGTGLLQNRRGTVSVSGLLYANEFIEGGVSLASKYVPMSREINGFTLNSDIDLTTSHIAEGSRLYYTDARVSANSDVSANSAHRVAGGNPHNTTFASLLSKPNTLAGYGITDAWTKGESDSRFLRTAFRNTITVNSSTTESLLHLNATDNAGADATLLSGKMQSNTVDRWFMRFEGIAGYVWSVSTDGTLRSGTIPWARISDVPDYAALVHVHSASDITSGTLSVARGGTGRSTLTSNTVLVGNGTSAVSLLSRLGIDTRTVFPTDASTHNHDSVYGRLASENTWTSRQIILTGSTAYPTVNSRNNPFEIARSNNILEFGIADTENQRKAWILTRHSNTSVYGDYMGTLHLQPLLAASAGRYKGVIIGGTVTSEIASGVALQVGQSSIFEGSATFNSTASFDGGSTTPVVFRSAGARIQKSDNSGSIWMSGGAGGNASYGSVIALYGVDHPTAPGRLTLIAGNGGNILADGNMTVDGLLTVGNATADNHALNRITADGRYSLSSHSHSEIIGKDGFTHDSNFYEKKIFAISQDTGSNQPINYSSTLHVGAGDTKRSFQVSSTYANSNAFYMRSMWNDGNSGAGSWLAWERLITEVNGDARYGRLASENNWTSGQIITRSLKHDNGILFKVGGEMSLLIKMGGEHQFANPTTGVRDTYFGRTSAGILSIGTTVGASNGNIAIGAATANNHAINLSFAENIFGKKAFSNIWDGTNTFNGVILVPSPTIDSAAVNRGYANSVYGRLASANTWTANNTFTGDIVAVNKITSWDYVHPNISSGTVNVKKLADNIIVIDGIFNINQVQSWEKGDALYVKSGNPLGIATNRFMHFTVSNNSNTGQTMRFAIFTLFCSGINTIISYNDGVISNNNVSMNGVLLYAE